MNRSSFSVSLSFVLIKGCFLYKTFNARHNSTLACYTSQKEAHTTSDRWNKAASDSSWTSFFKHLWITERTLTSNWIYDHFTYEWMRHGALTYWNVLKSQNSCGWKSSRCSNVVCHSHIFSVQKKLKIWNNVCFYFNSCFGRWGRRKCFEIVKEC